MALNLPETETALLTSGRESGKNSPSTGCVFGAARMLLTLKNGWYKMFAVVKTGGKQYKVAQGDVIQVEKLDVEAGKSVDLDEVLMICNDGKITAGTPVVAGAKVVAEVVSQSRTGKLIIFK
ncbi:MAG: 50S ribosomal protein L21, partial [Bdellovibrionales bacterium]